MAQLRLEPPEPFNFRTPDDWPRWKRRFEQFRIASGLQRQNPVQQVSTLLYCLGEEADAVLSSTNATEDERKVYATVIDKFDAFFKVRRNVIFERARFNRRNQLDGETAEQYIMELYRLAESCDYGDLKDEMIRDRLVVGIRDAVLSQQLQLDPDLTLEKAKKMVRQQEAVHDQQQVLKGVSNEAHVVEELRTKGRFTQPSGTTKPKRPQQRQPQKHHTVSSTHASAWLAKVKLCDRDTVFQLDTGAEVTAISQHSFKRLGEQKLAPPGKALYGPSHQLLQVAGQFQGKFSYKTKTAVQTVYVVNGLRTNLLGLPAITALNIVARVDASMTTSKGNNTPELCPKVKQELESIGVFPKVHESGIHTSIPEETTVILCMTENQPAPPWPD